MQQDVLVQGLGHRATACCTSPCARDGPLCNRPVQHPCARGDPLCNTLVHHTIPVQEAALCAMDLCTTACARGHACAQLLVQEESQCATALHNTRAPPLVQEKPHVQMPCTPPLAQHPVCTTPRARGAPSCKCLAHHPLCNALAHHPLCNTQCAPPLVQEKPHVQMPCTPPLVHHKRPSCKEHSRARPSCNAVVHRRPPMVGMVMEGGGVCRKSQPNSLRIH